jgi:hypothetical protein
VTSAASGLEAFDHVPRVVRYLPGARYLREDDRDPEDLDRLAETRERARVLALVWALPTFFVARDLDRFVAVVLAPRVFFFVSVRSAGRFFVERDGDLGAE